MRIAALMLAMECSQAGTVMPAVFEQGMVFLDQPAPDHSSVHLFTDSGGGPLTLSGEAADRLQLRRRITADEKLLMEFGPNVRTVNANA